MEIPDNLSVGERIRLLRESRGMPRPVLAQMCGRGPDWLKRIENGDRELRSYSLLFRLAAALQVPDLSVITGQDSDAGHPVPTGRLSHPGMPSHLGSRDEAALRPCDGTFRVPEPRDPPGPGEPVLAPVAQLR